MTITLDQARAHVKADGDDDEMVSAYLALAYTMVGNACNRSLYADQEASDTDYLVALSQLQEAEHARYAAIANAETNAQVAAIKDRYHQIIGNLKKRINGIPIDGTIDAAVLITLHALYHQREDVPEVPQRALAILDQGSKVWVGDLADDPEGGS
jgi:hypothetical protein